MARPTKLNKHTHKLIVDALLIGATRKDSAVAAGVDYTTFLNWMSKGRKAKSGIFFEFYNACDQSEAQARLNYTQVIQQASISGEWRAALEYLKRRDRENWGDNMDVTSTGESVAFAISRRVDDSEED